MRDGYSIKKGLGKGLKAILGFAILGVTVTGFADVAIWDLIVTHVKPLLGGATVGGFLFFASNWVNFNLLSNKA